MKIEALTYEKQKASAEENVYICLNNSISILYCIGVTSLNPSPSAWILSPSKRSSRQIPDPILHEVI